MIFRYNPTIVMEVGIGERYKRFSKKAVEMLLNFGYKMFKINDDGEIEELTKDIFSKNQDFKNPDSINLVFIKNHN